MCAYNNLFNDNVCADKHMKLSEEIKNQIIEALKPIEPEKVILFGSYAHGEPTESSDIDLYVVTKDDFVPQNFKEKMKVKLRVSGAIRELRKKYDIDLIVHTKKMNRKFVEMDSLFSREILYKGEILYE